VVTGQDGSVRILIVGGTRFVGRHIVETALVAGHEVTLLHRGRTGGDLFPDATHLLADRNGDLGVLAGGRWDATVDVSAYRPVQVSTLAAALGGNGGHYVFISSVSVYEPPAAPGYAEDSPVRELPPGPVPDTVTDETYGALKVLCERAAVEHFGPGTLVVRPTYVIGGDLNESGSGAEHGAGEVFVVESGAHRLARLTTDPTDATAGRRYRTERPPTVLAPGEVRLDVVFTPAPGQKLDDSFGVPTRLEVSASPPGLLLAGAGVSSELSRTLRLADPADGGVLQVVAQAATCDAEAEHPACHLTRQDWGVPVRLDPAGPRELRLILRG